MRTLVALLALFVPYAAASAEPAVTARCTAFATIANGAPDPTDERAAYAVGRDETEALELLALLTGSAPCDRLAVSNGAVAASDALPADAWKTVPTWRPGLSHRPAGRADAI